jgi:hypothetical protein
LIKNEIALLVDTDGTTSGSFEVAFDFPARLNIGDRLEISDLIVNGFFEDLYFLGKEPFDLGKFDGFYDVVYCSWEARSGKIIQVVHIESEILS